jgi:tetratricopeptide (TPR) repeat protein
MGAWRVWRSGLSWLGLGAWCGLLWVGLVGVAAGQGVEMQPVEGLLPGALPTVSVASLRIPEKAWTHFDRAQEAMQANRTEEYERETAKALAIAPGFAEVYLLRAIHEVKEHRFEAAIEDVAQAQREEPGVGWAGVILAGAYNGAQRWADAALILERLQGAEADTWQARFERTRAALGRGDVAGALHWSEQAVSMAPASCPEVHLLRAHALSMARRWPAAIAEMEAYLAMDPPQARRKEVLALLESTRSLAEEDGAIASR